MHWLIHTYLINDAFTTQQFDDEVLCFLAVCVVFFIWLILIIPYIICIYLISHRTFSYHHRFYTTLFIKLGDTWDLKSKFCVHFKHTRAIKFLTYYNNCKIRRFCSFENVKFRNHLTVNVFMQIKMQLMAFHMLC